MFEAKSRQRRMTTMAGQSGAAVNHFPHLIDERNP
jgi:hypothetical protein